MNPYALYCTQVDGLRIHDVDIDLRKARGAWQYGLFCSDVSDADLRSIRIQGLAKLSARAAIGLRKTTAGIRDCDAESKTSTFLDAADASHAYLSGCDLSQASKPTMEDGSSKIKVFAEPPRAGLN
jgi:uncharacterized protein YjbI with pentapeptide repeats